MAKGQKRSNRELKKPKMKKVAAPLPTSALLTRGISATAATTSKKKG